MKFISSPQLFTRTTAVIAGALFCVLLLGITTLAARASTENPGPSTGRLITVYDRGGEQSFLTEALTVKDALRGVGIELDERDRVEPALEEELVADSYAINIYRARPIVVVDGTIRQKVITSAQTSDQIATSAEMTLYPEDTTRMKQSNDILADGAALQMVIDRATPFAFTLYGETTTARTQADTVGQMLKEKGIILQNNDRVSVDVSTKITPDLSVRVWREGRQTITNSEPVAFTTEQIRDANRESGYKEVQTKGENGERNVTYEVVIQDGKEVSRTEIASVTTKEPTKQVEVIGVKFNYTGGPLTEAQITALGTCESGMTATRNSGNGFYGAFQFMPATWRTSAPAAYKGVLPHEAPLEAQKQAVQNLLSRSNIFNQFPGCAKKMRASGVI